MNKKMKSIDLQLFAGPTNQLIIAKGTTLAGGQTAGMLNPEQSEKFMQMVFDDSSFLGKMRHEMRRSTKGTIEKVGIGRRQLRAKTENVEIPQADYVEPVLSAIPYSCVDMVVGAEVSEKFYRENIERGGFENVLMGMIAKQVQLDLLDLYFNGDTADVSADAPFLTIMDGLIKQLGTGTAIVDAATLAAGDYTTDMFSAALEALPTKHYDPSKLVWIASPKTYLQWVKFLQKKNTTAGDMALLDGKELNPLGIKWEKVPNFPEGKIILADPKNFTAVTTYDIKVRKTVEGKSAVMKDTRYYATHLDSDIIVMEKEALVVVNNVPLNA